MKRITKIKENDSLSPSKKLRVAAYCRVSTDSDEQLVSLAAQKNHYESYIKENPEWEFAGLYFDEGISGTKKAKRVALLQMMKDCEQGKIDFIITKSISRFARNTTDCLEMVRKLIDLGIFVFFEKENLNTGSMESELMLSILSSLAESESVSISENSKWAIQKRFQNGRFTISYPPYGYRNVNSEMVVDPVQAEVVKFIFAETLAGKSSGVIASELQERKIPSRKGGNWTPTTVRGILSNEKYVGDVIFQKTYTDSHFNRHTNYGEWDQYMMQNHHEAIISREDFKAAGLLINQRAKEKGIRKGTSNYQNRYPFSGRIICGECGAKFKRRIHSTSRVKYAAWCCNQHIEDITKCSIQYIREDALEQAFITMMNKLVFGRKVVLKPLLDALREKSRTDGLWRINELESRLEKNLERRQVLMGLMTKGYLEPALFNQENNELLAEAEQMNIEKENLSFTINGELTRTEEVSRLLRFANKEEMLTVFDGDLFEYYVEQIVVCSRTEIAFHMKCGLILKEGV